VLIRGEICANNGEMMREAAIAGLGLVILPLFIAAPALRDGRLVAVLPEAVPVPDWIHALYPPMRHVPLKLRALIDHLVTALAGTPPWEEGLEGLVPGIGRAA
jgi:DNA-binding transcriptional LysR family regulator